MPRAQLQELQDRAVWLSAATTAAAIAVVALLCFVPLDSDGFWLQAAIGRLIRTSGEIPRTAFFPFTEARDFPFHAHEWLSSLGFYLLDERLGHDKLIFVKGLLGLALFGLAYRLSRRLTGSFTVSLLTALAAMAAANFRFGLRPELLALLLAAALLNLLVEYRLSGRRRWLVACLPLALAWANLHGSAPLAVATGAAFAGGAALERQRALPYLACTAAMALVLLANPYGTGVYRFAWEMENDFSGPFVGTRGFWAFAVYLAWVGAALALARGRIPAGAALLLAGFGALALDTQRHIAFFALASVYPVSAALAPLAPRWERLRAVRVGLLVLLLAAGGLVLRYGNLYGGFPYFVPSYAFSPLMLEYLGDEKLRGNVLNSYALGAELEYRFYPRLRPAIDSRVDVYGERYFGELERLQGDEAALRRFIERYDVRYMLLLWPEFNDGVRRMPGLQRDGWRIVFADHKMVLLGR